MLVDAIAAPLVWTLGGAREYILERADEGRRVLVEERRLRRIALVRDFRISIDSPWSVPSDQRMRGVVEPNQLGRAPPVLSIRTVSYATLFVSSPSHTRSEYGHQPLRSR